MIGSSHSSNETVNVSRSRSELQIILGTTDLAGAVQQFFNRHKDNLGAQTFVYGLKLRRFSDGSVVLDVKFVPDEELLKLLK